MRSAAEYSRHCSLLEQDDLSSADRQHYSTTFGVNQRASLHTLRYFDVTSGALIPDIMHDILEGALPLEVKLMLRVSLYACTSTPTEVPYKWGGDENVCTILHLHVIPSYTQLQVFVLQKKLFTLEFIDESLKKLNL